MAELARDTLSRLLWVGTTLPDRGAADSVAATDQLGSTGELLSHLAKIQASEAMVLAVDRQLAFLLLPLRDQGLVESLIGLMAELSGCAPAEAARQSQVLVGEQALERLFAAIAGGSEALGSGELDRVRSCDRLAGERAMVGPSLRRVLDAAYEAARALAPGAAQQSDGWASARAESMAAIALEAATRLHGDLGGCHVVLVGLGELSEALAVELRGAGVSKITLCHRSEGRAAAFAGRFGCHYEPWERLDGLLEAADILVSDVGAGRVVVTRAMLETALKARRRRPMFLIDLGLPPDVDEAAETLSDAFRYTLDDLERLSLSAEETDEVAGETGGKAGGRVAPSQIELAHALFWNRLAAQEEETTRGATAPGSLAARFEEVRQAVHSEFGSEGEAMTRELIRRLLALLDEAPEPRPGDEGGKGSERP